jgi:UPF0755 protein
VSNTEGGRRPGELPPEYQPVHHEPRRPDPRRVGPWQAGYRLGAPQGQQPPSEQGPSGGQGFVPGFGGDPDDEGEWIEPGNGAARYAEQPGIPARERGTVRRFAPLIALLVILTPIAFGGYYAYSLYQNRYHPPDYSGSGTGSVLIQVKPGDTATGLAPELVSLGVVASERAFVLAAEHSTSGSGLVPGFFRLHEHMQASLAYAALLNRANVVEIKITIPEGWRLSRIIATLVVTDPHISQADYEKALTNPALGLPSYSGGKAEGYLFPATYQIQPNATALSVLQQMVQAFDVAASSVNLANAASSMHLTPAKAVIVASLVQAEGGRLSDFPKIARVIYNRLAQGINLDLDSTVFYGLNTYGIAATDAQLQSNSPYNTYKFGGLPPGPIDSPGIAAIEAALHPASGDWLYFVTVDPKTGLTMFTDSEAQFEQYEAELRQNLGEG